MTLNKDDLISLKHLKSLMLLLTALLGGMATVGSVGFGGSALHSRHCGGGHSTERLHEVG